MLKSVNGRDYMSTKPITVSADANIFQAINELLVHKISGATVINDDNEVVGVISEFDCLKAILDGSYYGEINGTVGEYMTKNVETISADADILEVAQRLIKSKRRRLPVIEDGKFAGQFSIRSILEAVRDFDVPAKNKKKKK
ncbi:MAG: CBS domain-containing protein [Moraxellaceae bacterium]|nr:MAG: CBS domain-containing protein [Moraxellaceae bacterium]